MLHTKVPGPRPARGSIRIPQSFSDSPVTAETAEHAVARVGQFLARYGLVLVLAWIGLGHIVAPTAIQSLIGHSPPLSWLYGVFNTHTLGYALGSTEILAAILIAIRPLWSRVSAVGSAFAVLLFCSTISFLFTTPGVTSGGPVLSLLGEFLVKDVVLLGVSLWTLADSLGANRRTRPQLLWSSRQCAATSCVPSRCRTLRCLLSAFSSSHQVIMFG